MKNKRLQIFIQFAIQLIILIFVVNYFINTDRNPLWFIAYLVPPIILSLRLYALDLDSGDIVKVGEKTYRITNVPPTTLSTILYGKIYTTSSGMKLTEDLIDEIL